MKFYEGEEPLENIIQSYTIIGKDIIICFLDGSSILIENINKETIKVIEEKMLNQLKDRNSNFDIKYFQRKEKLDLTLLISLLGGTIANKIKNITMPEYMSILLLISTIYLYYTTYSEIEKITDVKKSNLFLDMYDELQIPKVQSAISNLLGDNLYTRDLTINTLDDFSYRTIKQIHKKIKKL